MNWKGILLIVLIIAVVVVGAAVIMMPKTIELDIEKVRTRLRNDTLYLEIEMDNDALTVFTDVTDYIHTTVYMDSLQLADMEIQRDTSDQTPQNIEIPGAVPVQNVLDIFDAEGDSVWLRMHITVGQNLPVLGFREFDIDRNIRMLKPRPPGINFVGIESYSLKKDSVHFIPEVYLINPNPVSITVIETDMVADIGDRFTSTVVLDPMITIPPHDSVLVRTIIGIQDFQLIKDGIAIVFGTSPMAYTVTGDMTVQLDSLEILAPIEMEIIHKGELSLSPFAE